MEARTRASPELREAGVLPIMLTRNTGALAISDRTPRLWTAPRLAGITIISRSFGVHISAAAVYAYY